MFVLSAFSALTTLSTSDWAFLPTLRYISSFSSSRKIERRFPFVSMNSIISIAYDNREGVSSNDITQGIPKCEREACVSP